MLYLGQRLMNLWFKPVAETELPACRQAGPGIDTLILYQRFKKKMSPG